MDLRVTMQLEEPVLAGDRKGDGVVSESLTVIPGGVLRAAFARQILAQCPYFDPGAEPANGHRFKVEYQGADGCTACPWARWCRHFDAVLFRQATPLGAQPLPFTVLGCKQDETHPLLDTLAYRTVSRMLLAASRAGAYEPESVPVCHTCGDRLEGRTGFRLHQAGSDTDQAVRVQRRLVTRSGMDHRRGVVRDGLLFSYRPIAEISQVDGRAEQTVMVTHIAVPDEGDWAIPVDSLLVGARVSQGLGRVTLTQEKAVEGELQGYGARLGLAERVTAFNRHLAAVWAAELARTKRPSMPLPRRQEGFYVPLLCTSEMDLGMAAHWATSSPAAVTEAEYLDRLTGWLRDSWAQADPAAQALEPTLVQAVVQYRHWAGWSWANGAQAPRPIHLRIKAGSVLLLHVRGEISTVVPVLVNLAQIGLGERREDGYGQVIPAHPIHFEGGA